MTEEINTYRNKIRPFDSKKIADMINNNPMELMELDMAEVTHYYDCGFIADILMNVGVLADVDRLIGIIDTQWKIDVGNRRELVVKYNPVDRSYEPYVPNLTDLLSDIRERIYNNKVLEKKKEELYREWALSHKDNVTSTSPSTYAIHHEYDAPQLTEGQAKEDCIKYHLSDLPEEVSNQILIYDDGLYCSWVNNMRGPVLTWIEKHNKQDWNVVRFICRLRGIVTRKCSLRIFGMLLEKIGLGNQENNMKQRQDANNDKFLDDYDDPHKKKNFWKLRKDGEAIEKELKPIIDQLSA